MTKQIEYFVFEYISDSGNAAYYPYYTIPDAAFPPMVRIKVVYGNKQYALNLSTYSDDRMMVESFLEYLIRQAISEFRKCLDKEVSEKARADLDRKHREFVKAADDYKGRATR